MRLSTILKFSILSVLGASIHAKAFDIDQVTVSSAAQSRVIEMRERVQAFSTVPDRIGQLIEFAEGDKGIILSVKEDTSINRKFITVYVTSSQNKELLNEHVWFTVKNERNVGEFETLNPLEVKNQITSKDLRESQILINQRLKLLTNKSQINPYDITTKAPDLSLDSNEPRFVSLRINDGISQSKGFADVCEDLFMNAKGGYKKLGALVANEISSYDSFFKKEPVKNITQPGVCPSFGQMNNQEKIHFFVYMVAAKSMAESTCGERKIGAENANAKGILQIDNSPLEVNAKGGYGCGNFNPMNDEQNLKCSMRILAAQMKNQQKLLSCGSYWAPLHPNGGFDGSSYCKARSDGWANIIGPLVKQYKPCNANLRSM